MKTKIDYLGKVAFTIEGDHNPEADYDKLCLVFDEKTYTTYVSRRYVPAGTLISDKKYWMRFSSLAEKVIIDYNNWIHTYGTKIDKLEKNKLDKTGNVVEAPVRFVFINDNKTTEITNGNIYLTDGTNKLFLTPNDLSLYKNGIWYSLTDKVGREEFIEEVELRSAIRIKNLTPSEANIKEEFVLIGANGKELGPHIKIYKDSSIENVFTGHVDDILTNADSSGMADDTQITSGTGDPALCIIYYLNNGKYKLTNVPIGDFLNEALFKDGLKVINNKVYVNISSVDSTANFLGINENGEIYLKGIQEMYNDILTLKKEVKKFNNVIYLGKKVDEVIANVYENIPGLVSFVYDRIKDRFAGNGMGYIILDKNISFEDQVGPKNTIYEIRYDFDLFGKEVTIPENCILKFKGGKLYNGILKGRLLNDYVKPEWFGAKGDGVTNDSYAVVNSINLSDLVILSANKTYNVRTINITHDVTVFGNNSTIKQISAGGECTSLITIHEDVKFTVNNVVFDGNDKELLWDYAYYNFIWCSIGSIELNSCIIKNTRGHALRLGNIDKFDITKFAHDVIIKDCKVIQNTEKNSCGDAIRIERTHNALIHNNYVTGGLSGIRCQLYCKNLIITNNVVRSSWADVGITVAQSENCFVEGNECSDHWQHGIECDAVCDCTITNNYCHDNKVAGIFCTAYNVGKNQADWARGTISEKYADLGYGYQDVNAPDLSNLNTIIKNNISINNQCPDILMGQSGLIYEGNYIHVPNHNGISSSSNPSEYNSQLYITGGSINKTDIKIINNTFDCTDLDTYVITLSNYQFDTVAYGNKHNFIKSFSNYPIIGSGDIAKNKIFNLRRNPFNSGSWIFDNTKYVFKKNVPYDESIILSRFKASNGYKLLHIAVKGTFDANPDLLIQLYDNDNIWKYTVSNTRLTTKEYDGESNIIKLLITPTPTEYSQYNNYYIQINPNGGYNIEITDIKLFDTSNGTFEPLYNLSIKPTTPLQGDIWISNNKPYWYIAGKWVDATGTEV